MTPRVIGTVESISYAEALSGDTWNHHCSRERGTPLLIRDCPHLKALGEQWTDAHIKAVAGSRTAILDISRDGTFAGGKNVVDGTTRRQEELSLAECIDRIRRTEGDLGTTKERAYVYGSRTEPFAPLLVEYSPPSALIPAGAHSYTQVWMGGAGNVTPAHFDVADNLLVQVRGRKKVLLWDPSHYPLLSVNPTGTKGERQSMMGDMHAVDVERYPHFAKAESLSCDLAPGDMLFIPLAWFHYILTLEFSISINHFWHSPELAEFMNVGAQLLRGGIRRELGAFLTFMWMEAQRIPTDAVRDFCPLWREQRNDEHNPR
ncbi:MAG: cupin-like domain-containing protein [Polyangiaceae bacterium]